MSNEHPSTGDPPQPEHTDAQVLLGAAATAVSDTPGARLRLERQRLGLALQRIADDLHLSKQAVECIEADRFAELGAPVFAKGHLRRYAVLLGVSVDEIVASYDRLSGTARAHESVPSRGIETSRRVDLSREGTSFRIAPRASNRRFGSSKLIWVALGVMLTGAAVWFALPQWSKWRAARNAPVVSVASDATTSVSAPAPLATSSTPTVNVDVPAAPVAVSTPIPVPVGNPPPGKVRVRLTFKQDSWAEVHDARGNRMLYDVGRADLPRVIDAEPPVLVILGNAPLVSVEINGQPAAIPARRIVNAVARFTVEADGRIK